MKEINYKSDFDCILSINDCEEESIGFPSFDFIVKVYTEWRRSKPYIISFIDGECENCFNDNGEIHVLFDNHRLGLGQLFMDFYAEIPDNKFPDGRRTESLTKEPMHIRMVEGMGNCCKIGIITIHTRINFGRSFEIATDQEVADEVMGALLNQKRNRYECNSQKR